MAGKGDAFASPDMFPFELLNSEARATNLLLQVRWREGLKWPHCRSEPVLPVERKTAAGRVDSLQSHNVRDGFLSQKMP